MEHASYEIGLRHDEKGEPLFVVDGKLLGTISDVKALIARFEDAANVSSYDTFDGDITEWSHA